MPARFEPTRVVEVWAPGTPLGMVGSGYLLGRGLVLTSRHVADHAADGGCEARPLGASEWRPAQRVWRGEASDAALLRVDDGADDDDPVAWLGRLGGDGRVACRAVGFPWAQSRNDGALRDTEDLAGDIAPLTGSKERRLSVHIAGSVPLPRDSRHSPWEGMSGAAVFSGPVIVGVICVAPAHFGTDRLEAVPITALAAEAGFRAVIAGRETAELPLPAAEDLDLARGVLRQPYQPLPPQATPERLRGGATRFLVAPEHGVVPFHGRPELEELGTWSEGALGLELALVIGPGGAGKTRLASELCRHALNHGGSAGFLETDATPERVERLAALTGPLLVVVDEAHARIDLVARLLVKLAAAPPQSPLRILLLARDDGEWWETLLPARLADSVGAAWACETATVHRLGRATEDRESAFRAAAQAFGPRIGRSAEDLPAPDLTGAHFEQILFVHLAALSRLEGESSLLRDDLLEFALRREAGYWSGTAAARRLQVDPVVLKRAVAVATITTARSEGEAAAALVAVPDLASTDDLIVRSIARWLNALYPPAAAGAPGGTWLRPLVPDVIGEALVAEVLADVPELAARLLSGAAPEQARAALTRLTQAARTHAAARDALAGALAAHLPALWRIAIAVAQSVGDPLGHLLAEAVERAGDDELGASVADEIPERTVALRELAVVATRQAIRGCERVAGPSERLAELQSDLARRLAEVGDPNDACAASDRAVAIARELAADQPETFRPLLAGMLRNHSATLEWAGSIRDALLAALEAREIAVELAHGNPTFHRLLADVSMNLSVLLGAAGFREGALEELDRAIYTYRFLADAHPDWARPSLAGALLNRAPMLLDLGRPEEAVDAADEGLCIYRTLADERPDAFAVEHARMLHNQSNALAAVGRAPEALAAVEEAVRIVRALADARPAAFDSELSSLLTSYAQRLDASGHRGQALRVLEEAVPLRRALAESDPVLYGPDLAQLLDYLATLLDNPRQALGLIDTAWAIYETLPPERHGPALPAMGCLLDNRVIRLLEVDRVADAESTAALAVRIHRALSEQDGVFLPELSNSLHQHALCLSMAGRLDPAAVEIGEAVEIRRRLAERDPGRFKPLLARSLGNQAGVQAQSQRPEDALASAEEAVAIYRELAARDPDEFAADLAEALHNVAVALEDAGRPGAALESVEEGIEVLKRLEERIPTARSRAAFPLLLRQQHLESVLGEQP
jgi:tetratricopeptide (TPR) repeat protein